MESGDAYHYPTGAYSQKYQSLEQERVRRMREEHHLVARSNKERAQQLSKLTQQRRRALEEKKRAMAQAEEDRRRRVLEERRRQQQAATDRFHSAITRLKQSRQQPQQERGGKLISTLPVEMFLPVKHSRERPRDEDCGSDPQKKLTGRVGGVSDKTPSLEDVLEQLRGGRTAIAHHEPAASDQARNAVFVYESEESAGSWHPSFTDPEHHNTAGAIGAITSPAHNCNNSNNSDGNSKVFVTVLTQPQLSTSPVPDIKDPTLSDRSLSPSSLSSSSLSSVADSLEENLAPNQDAPTTLPSSIPAALVDDAGENQWKYKQDLEPHSNPAGAVRVSADSMGRAGPSPGQQPSSPLIGILKKQAQTVGVPSAALGSTGSVDRTSHDTVPSCSEQNSKFSSAKRVRFTDNSASPIASSSNCGTPVNGFSTTSTGIAGFTPQIKISLGRSSRTKPNKNGTVIPLTHSGQERRRQPMASHPGLMGTPAERIILSDQTDSDITSLWTQLSTYFHSKEQLGLLPLASNMEEVIHRKQRSAGWVGAAASHASHQHHADEIAGEAAVRQGPEPRLMRCHKAHQPVRLWKRQSDSEQASASNSNSSLLVGHQGQTRVKPEHGNLSDEEQRLMESIEQLNERLRGRVLDCEEYRDTEGVDHSHTLPAPPPSQTRNKSLHSLPRTRVRRPPRPPHQSFIHGHVIRSTTQQLSTNKTFF